MATQTLESNLRRRLLALVAPAIVAVGVASIAITWRALDVADDLAARTRTQDFLRELRRELGEGDPVDRALRETLTGADDDGLRVEVQSRTPITETRTKDPLPGDLATLEEGRCARARDEHGAPWHGCRIDEDGFTAIVAIPVEAHAQVLRTLIEWMVAIVGLALFATALAARLAVRRPLASLQRLVEWSERVVVTSDEAPIPAADTAEIQRLSTAFEALVRRLFEALARERATSAHAAHELRTPLTAMRAELEALTPIENEPARRMLVDVDRLSRVIDAILVLSAPPTPSRAVGVVNVADVARSLAGEGTEVDAPDEALIDAEPRLVELALLNLLENAVKYSGHAARMVQVSRAEDGVRVAILDDGPGLDEEARARMFDRYWRGASDGAGSGLGLALVRAVAERYGGHAEARPNPSGRGLEVAITFGSILGWHENP